MRAEQSVVGNMIEIELCPDCPLNEKLSGDSIFATVGGPSATSKATELFLSDGKSIEGLVGAGVVRNEHVIQAFDGCKEAVKKGLLDPRKVTCGALVELKQRRK